MKWPSIASLSFLNRRRWRADGSLAIVTGASSGIGRELTRQLVEHGCRVIAVARRRGRLDELVSGADTGKRPCEMIIPIVGDITDEATRHAAWRQVDQHGDGRLDLLVNNAGIGGIGRFIDAEPERMRQIMEVNFHAPVEWTREAIPYLKNAVIIADRHQTPVICNIGSVLGHRAVPEKSEYCASKFAMHGWTDAIRAELVADGIAVVLVSPSTTRSEFFDSLVGTDPGQKSASIGSWSTDAVARATYRAIVACRSEVILSLGGKALVYGDRISPPILNAVLARRSED